MNVKFDKNDNVNGVLTVEVEVADYTDKVKKELKHISDTHVIPGFRKGHVPASILRHHFGKQVKSDVINREVYEAVTKYIEDNKLSILGQPMPLEVKEINLDDEAYTFKYKIGLAPEVDVVVDKTVKLPYTTIKVTDEMIDTEDKSLRERFGKQVPGEVADEKALIKGEIRQLNADGSVDESETAVVNPNGIVGPFAFASKEEAAKFLGKKVGDKVVFNPYIASGENVARVASMLEVDKEKAEELKGDFEMTINEIIVVKLAELGQEYYDELFGKDKVTSEEQYREELKKAIASDLDRQSQAKFEFDAHKYFTTKYGDIEMPVEFLKEWLVTNDSERFNAENVDEEFAKVLPDVKWQIISDKIAEKLGTKVTEEDMKQMAAVAARQQLAQYGIPNADQDMVDNFAQRMLAQKEYRQQLASRLSELKLFTDIRNAVTLEPEEVTIEEFNERARKSHEA